MFIVTYHLLNVTILGQKRGCQLCADSILWQKDSPVPPLKRTWPPVAMFQACLCFRSCFVPLYFTRQLKNQLQFIFFFFKEKSELLFGGKCKCWRLLTPTQRLCNQIGMSTPVSMPPSSNEWQIAPNTLMTSPAEKMDVAYCRPPPWSQCFFWGGGGFNIQTHFQLASRRKSSSFARPQALLQPASYWSCSVYTLHSAKWHACFMHKQTIAHLWQ